MGLIGACFSRFNEHFQNIDNLFAQHFQVFEGRFEFEGRYPDGISKKQAGAGEYVLPSGVVLTGFSTTSFVPIVGYRDEVGVEKDKNQADPRVYPDDYWRRVLPAAPAFLQELELALGIPISAGLSAFVNAPGSGLALHHDRFDQLLFQIRGSKRFRYLANRYVEQPSVQFTPFATAPLEWAQSYRHGFPRSTQALLEEQLETVELEPGSVIFMPGGLWHTTAEQPDHALARHFLDLGRDRDLEGIGERDEQIAAHLADRQHEVLLTELLRDFFEGLSGEMIP